MNGKPVAAEKIIFDSNILMNLFNEKIDAIVFWNRFKKCKRYISVITEMELLSYPDLTPQEEGEIRIFLKTCRIIPLRRKIKDEGINFRKTIKCKLPDSIIAATAVIYRLTLISNDTHLLTAAYPGLQSKPFQ
jgi:predicted nucleic acid-binding protein